MEGSDSGLIFQSVLDKLVPTDKLLVVQVMPQASSTPGHNFCIYDVY